MKKILIVAGGLIALAAPALAADMAPRYTKAPPPLAVPVFNWSGFYIGGFVGGAAADRNVTSTEPLSAGGLFFYNDPGLPNSYSLPSSFIGGGTIGWNYQPVGSNWLFGIEGEAGYLRLNRTIQDRNAIASGFGFPDSLVSTRIGDWYGVIAGRLGFTADRFLVYGKGGAAFVNKSGNFADNCVIAPCGGGILNLGRTDNTFVTWAAGGGVEYALTNNWSIKSEYLYLATRETFTSSGTQTAGPSTGTVYTNVQRDPGIHTGKIGINYRFGGPIVANY